MKIINIYDSFKKKGGAQNVVYSLHSFFDTIFNSELCSLDKQNNSPFEKHFTLNLLYILKNKKALFISHHRKTTTYLMIIQKTFLPQLKLIHIAHNEFSSLKYLSLFPKNNVAVSHCVRRNMVEYFGISKDKVHVIHNGIKDAKKDSFKEWDKNNIRILYPARISKVKGQLELVNRIADKINPHVIIDFAGEGPDANSLAKLCKDSINFRYLGFKNISHIIKEYDFVMLFSSNEGLPISLIEATMYYKPIISNNVGGNMEIVKNDVNGFIRENYEDLIILLNQLCNLPSHHMKKLALNSRTIYESHFTEDRMFKEYYNYLTSLFFSEI